MTVSRARTETNEAHASTAKLPAANARRLTPSAAITVSFERLLSVPPEIIFRTVQGKHLLTRTEGQMLARLGVIAQELDLLAAQAEKTLLAKKNLRVCRDKLLYESQNVSLRSINALLSTCDTRATASLKSVQRGLSSRLAELAQFPPLLRQSAEQNWSIADSILDAPGEHSGDNLAREKRNVAELEEKLISNIERLMGLTANEATDKRRNRSAKGLSTKKATKRNLFGKESKTAGDAPWGESIGHLCESLFLNPLSEPRRESVTP